MKFGWGHIRGSGWRAFAVRQMVMCCILLVSFSQFASASHSYEQSHQHEHEQSHHHEHEEPSHKICNVCILAVNDETYPDVSTDTDLVGDEHDLARFHARRLALVEYITAPSFALQFRVLGPPVPPILRRNEARAPPVQL